MAKTEAEVGNINARSRISTARTKTAIANAVDGNVMIGELERGTLDRALERAWSIGWSAGAKDASQ